MHPWRYVISLFLHIMSPCICPFSSALFSTLSVWESNLIKAQAWPYLIYQCGEELFPRNCWENKKIDNFQKFCLACQTLILPWVRVAAHILCHDLLHCRQRNVFCPWLGSWEHSVHPEEHFSWMMAFPFYPSDLVQLRLSVRREIVESCL